MAIVTEEHRRTNAIVIHTTIYKKLNRTQFFLLNMKFHVLYGLLACAVFFTSCGSTKNKYEGPSAVDRLMRDLSNEPSYSIILHDMQMDESKNTYQHKYKVFKDIEKDSIGKVSEWTKVSESFFAENLDNMGLEVASKSTDGKTHKIPSPPGFNTTVGNPKYGEWRQGSDGHSFWAYYGRYAFMNSMINAMHPTPVIYQTSYGHYTQYRLTTAQARAPTEAVALRHKKRTLRSLRASNNNKVCRLSGRK
jgi:hypothetical protein